MKGNEVTQQEVELWKKEGRFPVSCRLCGEIWLFNSEHYSPKDFIGWECPNCKRRRWL